MNTVNKIKDIMTQFMFRKLNFIMVIFAVLLSLTCSLSLQAKGAVSQDMIVGEWVLDKAVFIENQDYSSSARELVYSPSQNNSTKIELPFRFVVTNMLVLFDNLNLSTRDMSLVDAQFELRYTSNHQELIVDDNRIVDKDFSHRLIFNVELDDDTMTLYENIHYRNDDGKSVSGLLTSTLVRI